MEGLQNLLRIKLLKAALSGFKQPMFGVQTQSLTVLLNKLKSIFHGSFYEIRSKNILAVYYLLIINKLKSRFPLVSNTHSSMTLGVQY